MHALGYQPGVKTILFCIKCSINLCKLYGNARQIAMDTGTVVLAKIIFNDEAFWHSITYPNFRILSSTGVKQSLEDSSFTRI